jgi:uncharacterized protein
MQTYVDLALPPSSFPAFRPHRLLWNGHLQTLSAHFSSPPKPPIHANRHEVDLGDGDRLVYLDSAPPGWRRDQPIVLMVHGLCGCAESQYIVRIARRLLTLGFRVARINLRGAGTGFGLARGIYHAGRTEDVLKAAEQIASNAPGSPIVLLGFSLGGNLVLKLGAELGQSRAWLDSIVAVNPPIELEACSTYLRSGFSRLYDRHFVRLLRQLIERLHVRFPDLGEVDWRKIKSIYDFDDFYTAPRNGFSGAIDYYRRASAGPLIKEIARPGLVLTAADDPFIPVSSILQVEFPSLLEREVAPYGGHLGYVSRTRFGPNHHWLDARICHWLSNRLGFHSAA